MRGFLACVVCLALGGGVAAAQDGEGEAPPESASDAPAAPAPAPPAIHAEGEYGGVVPGRARATSAAPAAATKKRAPARAPTVSWIGFQRLDGGGARVFMQLSQDVPYEQSLVGDSLVVALPGAKLGHRNQSRFIDTSFFDTRVARVETRRLKGKRGGVEVVVTFRKGASAKADARVETGADGARYLYLDFAPPA